VISNSDIVREEEKHRPYRKKPLRECRTRWHDLAHATSGPVLSSRFTAT